jgi:hypothetical protein
MPSYVRKFASQSFVEQMILDTNDRVYGSIRIKPSSVQWKPKNQNKFYTVPLDSFVQWIMAPSTCARRTKS